jgi:dihydrolipoamide dehydrogenase
VGGGFIGLEIGTFFSKLGTKVTVVEATEQLLPGTDKECVEVVFKKLKKKGIELLLKTKAKDFKKVGTKAELTVETADGQSKKILSDWILLTVGRKPRSKDLGLEKIGVQANERGFIPVNNHLLTSCPGVYAIGDVIGGPMLAHKASKEGLVAVEHMKNPSTTIDIKALPWAIFVDPEIAVVGHSEESARAAGWNPVTGKCPFVANGRALTTGEAEGFAKIIVDRDSDRILGATMVGPDVSNLIMEVAVAIEMGATSHDLALTVHAHPTLPETLMEAAEAVHGRAIHFFQRKPSTPTTTSASVKS